MWITLEFRYKKAPKLKSPQRTMSTHGSYLTSGALLLFLGFSYLITYSMYAFIHSFASLHLYLEHLADSTTFFFSKYLWEIGDSCPALQHPALPGVCHSTSTKETTLYYPASNFANCFAPKLWLQFPPWYAILYLLGHIYPWGFFLFIVGLLLLLL